ncbi:hypothetical protein [Pseudomonas aeruginosa]|uniref:hypothetical protein n=1 Tax=Pseudomonas aeruginosa TaxID=287 RepID=UPI00070B0010|nr:hypothetical protein [Pseudomonas aeruginosa]
MPTIHFYDTVTAGRSPTEGQVIRFDSAVYPARGSVDLSTTNIKLRDDVYLDPDVVMNSDLALLAFDQGCSEVEWARRVFADFTRPNTLHIAFGSTTRHDPFIRASFYRNLLPYPCLGVPDTAHFLDLDVLLRAILLIRPGECPWDVETLTGGAAGLYQFLMWDAGLGTENRALRVKEVLSKISEASPKLLHHAVTVSSPSQIKALLGLDGGEVWDLRSVNPVVMVHPSLPDNRGAILAMPVAADVSYPDLICMVDLEADLSSLCSDSTESLQHLSRANKGDRSAPLFHISMSRIPFVAPLSAIRPDDAKRLGINVSAVKANIQRLTSAKHLVGRLRDEPVLQLNAQPADVDHRMWAGDFPSTDLDLMRQLHSSGFKSWQDLLLTGTDRRLRDLGNRMLGRYQPDALSPSDRGVWLRHVDQRVRGDFSGSFRLEQLMERAEDMCQQYPTAAGVQGFRERLHRLKGMINDGY